MTEENVAVEKLIKEYPQLTYEEALKIGLQIASTILHDQPCLRKV